jgi:hypothetical protein
MLEFMEIFKGKVLNFSTKIYAVKKVEGFLSYNKPKLIMAGLMILYLNKSNSEYQIQYLKMS